MRTKQRTLGVFVALLLVIITTFSLIGCGNSNPIVGKWKNARSGDLIEFKSDGTLSYTNSTFKELGVLEGKWYPYKNNPVDVNGEKWYIYTIDSYMDDLGVGQYSEDIGGEYQEGRSDFAVNGDLAYGAAGFTLADPDDNSKFDEDRIKNYLDDPDDIVVAYLTYMRE